MILKIKKIALVWGFLLFACSFVLGQIRDLGQGGGGFPSGGGGGTKRISREDYRKKQDSLDANAIKPEVKLWRLEADGAYKVRRYRDSLKMDWQILHPFYKENPAVTFTGNLGAPYQSAIFSKRENIQEFLFLQPYECYLERPETHNFIDTKTPYTDLQYATGKSGNEEDNILKVFLTRNIKKGWNLGVRYNLLSSDGAYENQKNKIYSFSVFSSYELGRYKLYGFLNHNRLQISENGGMEDDVLIERDTTIKTRDMGVRLAGVGAKFHNYNYFLSHQYNIGEVRERVLFSDTTQVYPIKLVHTLHLDKSSRVYFDEEQSPDFYKSFIYKMGGKISETTNFQNLKNTLQIVLNEGYFDWFKYGLRAAVQYEKIKYEIPDLSAKFPFGWDTALSSHLQDNLSAEFGAFFSSTEKTNWAASWKTYLSGYRMGDVIAKGHYRRYLGADSLRNHKLQLDFQMQNLTPSFLYNDYFSNHRRWQNDFGKQASLKVGGYYSNKKWKLRVGGYLQALSNYVYFGKNASPEQTSEKISVLTAFAKIDLNWRKWHLEPAIYWQKTTNENILPLPMLALYSNAYFESEMFEKAITLRLGADVRYTTKWTAPSYFPAIGQYYLQTEKELGAYPKIDAYFVARFKRASFFMKYQHLNRVWGSVNYFSAPHYPIAPNVLRYGIRWYFYD